MKNRLPAESSVIGADNHTGPVIIKKATRSAPEPNPNGEAALAIWKVAKPAAGTLVETYLAARGITIPIPPSIRYHPSLKHGPTGLDLPAMVAAVQAPDRTITGIHRTFLTADGSSIEDRLADYALIDPGTLADLERWRR